MQRYHVGAHHRGGGSVLEARLFFGRYISHLAIERKRHSPVDSLQRLPVPRDVPRTKQLKARVEAYPAYRHLKVDFFGASLETGYFERFTRVLLAETKYVAVVDDDVIVAPRYLEICLRAASIKRFQGLIEAGSSSAS